MKIKSVKISNVLSFPFIEDIDAADETIVFDLNTNILIGPNGSGKSNMIEILSVLMQSYFFTPFEFFDEDMGKENQTQKPIRLEGSGKANRQNSFGSLIKHRYCKDKDSQLILQLGVDTNDISNLNFVIDNWGALLEINNSYTKGNSFFAGEWDFEKIKLGAQFDTIVFPFQLYIQQGQFTLALDQKKLSIQEQFIAGYLQSFNLIQKMIELGSISGSAWKYLKNPFALISSMRSYGTFGASFRY